VRYLRLSERIVEANAESAAGGPLAPKLHAPQQRDVLLPLFVIGRLWSHSKATIGSDGRATER
jgi:hypothetical protein